MPAGRGEEPTSYGGAMMNHDGPPPPEALVVTKSEAKNPELQKSQSNYGAFGEMSKHPA